MNTTESLPARPRSPARSSRLTGTRLSRAMTLIEVMMAMGLLTMTTLGVLGTFLNSRRNTDFQKKQILVDTMMQGILEQLKNRTMVELFDSPVTPGIPTAAGIPAGEHALTSMTRLLTYIGTGAARPSVSVELDTNPANNVSNLYLSPYPYLLPVTNIPAGAIPADGDNNGYGNVDGIAGDDVAVNTIYLDTKGTNGLDGSVLNTTDDLRINVMIWIKNYYEVSGPISVSSKTILINYTWTYTDGRVSKPMIGSVRGIKTPL